MQMQTLTVTTETVNIENSVFVVSTYDLTTTGFCDICGKQETNSKDNLRASGWHLDAKEHFCPDCNV